MNWALAAAISLLSVIIGLYVVLGIALIRNDIAWHNLQKRNHSIDRAEMQAANQRECAETQIDEWA